MNEREREDLRQRLRGTIELLLPQLDRILDAQRTPRWGLLHDFWTMCALLKQRSRSNAFERYATWSLIHRIQHLTEALSTIEIVIRDFQRGGGERDSLIKDLLERQAALPGVVLGASPTRKR